jgi:formylglycine-generating enzyme required for sulfatase activity
VETLLGVWLPVFLGAFLAAHAFASDMRAPTRRASITEPINGMQLVFVRGGCFVMGDTAGDGEADERPLHEVCVDAFYMGKYEITVGQFRDFVHEVGYVTDAETGAGGRQGCESFDKTDAEQWAWRSWATWRTPNQYQENQDAHPVSCVSWRDATAFARWLSEKSGHAYRLPTEAEWEYAARGGTRTRNYWGAHTQHNCRYANVSDQTPIPPGSGRWTKRHACADGYPFVAPVGRFQPNAFGLYDMMGNVWEWCADGYDKDYYQKGPRTNPVAAPPAEAPHPEHVLRGGSWDYGPGDVRVAYRYGYATVNRCVNSGFRLARDP